MRVVAVLCVGMAIGCGPDIDQNCEDFCELAYECTVIPGDEVDECEDDCVDESEDDNECADSIDAFLECMGGTCGNPECASEANDLDEC
jgi:hypothetical protein